MVEYHIGMNKYPKLSEAKKEALRRDGRKGAIVRSHRRFGYTSWVINVVVPRRRKDKTKSRKKRYIVRCKENPNYNEVFNTEEKAYDYAKELRKKGYRRVSVVRR